MKTKKAITGAILLTMLIATTQAIKVGVILTFPDGTTQTECIDATTNQNAYEILEKTGINMEWSYHPIWGHGLCGINGFGCPADNCWCTSDYWGFYIADKGSWKYSPVGFDAGDECWNRDWNSFDGHYCASEGDMLGLAYGPYGTKPEKASFEDVCQQDQRGQGGSGVLANMTVNITETPRKGGTIEVRVSDENRNRTIKKAQVIVYDNTAGTKRLYDGLTDENGVLSFTLDNTGLYLMEVRALYYNTIHQAIEVLDPTTTSTTSTTTTSTASSTSTTSTTMLPHIALEQKTTRQSSTTTEATTTTIAYENKITGKAVANPKETTGDARTGVLAAAAGVCILYLIRKK